MVVQRRDGPRRLREIDDDDDVATLRTAIHLLLTCLVGGGQAAIRPSGPPPWLKNDAF